MKDLMLVKLGGSLITDKSKPFTERKDIISRLAKEIHEARDEKEGSLILGHGGGSYPHKPASDFQTHRGFINHNSTMGLAEVQDAAARLNRIVVRALLDSGEEAMSIQPSAASLTKNGRISKWHTESIERLLGYGMLPVVFGDVGIDLEKGSCIVSTEELFRYLTTKLPVRTVIMCGKTDGVFTADPGKDGTAEHIPEITRESFASMRKHLSDSDGIDVTGGMVHKIEQALELAKEKATVIIMNGNTPGNLKKAMLGEKVKGTVIR